MRGAIPPLTQYAFMAWCSVKKKHMDNFIFTLFLSSQIRQSYVCTSLKIFFPSSIRPYSSSPPCRFLGTFCHRAHPLHLSYLSFCVFCAFFHCVVLSFIGLCFIKCYISTKPFERLKRLAFRLGFSHETLEHLPRRSPLNSTLIS
jgi:hypothetical protein